MISQTALLLLQITYTICLIILFLFSINSITLSILYLVKRKKIWKREIPEMRAEWPLVTIQLHLFNERYMIDRLIKAAVNIDYPKDKLQIQVLDDSTDSTTEVAATLVDTYRAAGFNIQLLHRVNRSGYKAGAMEQALRKATGEFVAVFDADFLPDRDWLRKVIPFFQDPQIGFVQTRWGHLNNHYNLITRLAGMALDAHFVVEQTARAGANLLMSFNGTAGMWRVAAIESAGGWQGDTLTEDIDLSFRAEMAGWKYVYLPEVVVLSELPAQMDALKKQQVRWVKGNMQVQRKLVGKVLKSKLSFWQKLMGLIHLNMLYLPYPITVLTIILTFPINLYAPNFMTYFGWTMIGMLGPVFLYTLAKTKYNPSLIERITMIPALMMLGVGISVNCTWGILTGFSSKSGVFERTPKFNLQDAHASWAKNNYAISFSPIALAEFLMGAYILLSSIYLHEVRHYVFPIWQMLPASAYFLVSGSSLVQSLQRLMASSERDKAESTIIPG